MTDRMRLHLNTLMVAVAASYLTLGLFIPDRAQALWAVYAGLSGALALVNLLTERRR